MSVSDDIQGRNIDFVSEVEIQFWSNLFSSTLAPALCDKPSSLGKTLATLLLPTTTLPPLPPPPTPPPLWPGWLPDSYGGKSAML